MKIILNCKIQFRIIIQAGDNPSNSPSIGSDANAAAAIDDGERRRQETALDGAIVESIPGNALSAEDSDPQVSPFKHAVTTLCV